MRFKSGAGHRPANPFPALRLLCRAALFAFILLVPALAASAADEDIPPLIIFHTNDVHGYAREVRDEQGRLTHIGYPRVKAYIDKQPAGHKMLLDAGDVLHGQPLAVVTRGEAIARMLEILNYDALAAGNHDFDYGLPRLMQLRDKYGLNFIAANIIEKEDGAPLLPSHILKDFGGFKVGVFGLSTPATPLSTSPGNVRPVVFGSAEDAAEIAGIMVHKLKKELGADLVIALTHLGTNPQNEPSAQDIARGAPGIDLIIDGHSHSEVAGLMVGETMIVSAGAFLKNLGQVTVSRDSNGRPVLAPRLIKAREFGSVTPEPILDTLIAELSAELDKDLARVAASTPFALDGEREHVRNTSTNFGRILCAAIRKATRADAAIFNGGGIRASIGPGEITRGELLTALPYGNYALTVRIKGSDLLKALNNGLAQPNGGGFPQFYGLRVTARETKSYAADGSIIRRGRVESVEIGDRRLDPEAFYTIAVNDFMYDGGDGYDVFAKYPSQTHRMADEILLDYLAQTDPDVLNEINQDDVLAIIVEEPAAGK